MDFLLNISSFECNTPILIISLLTLITLVGGYLKLKSVQPERKKLPPGWFGFPLIGESFSFLRACRQDKVDEWLQIRGEKYGPIFKTSLFGAKMVVLTGQAGSRFVFHAGDSGISFQQPKTVLNILGKNNLFELTGARHKLIRGAIVGFFRPESIQRFVGEMDLLVTENMRKELDGKDCTKIVDMMKKVAFNVAWSVFFGLADEKEKDKIFEDFKDMEKGVWAIPVDFPGTAFNKAMKARAKLSKRLLHIVQETKRQVDQTQSDSILIRLVNLRDEKGEKLAVDVILDIFFTLIMASHDSVSILMTLLVRHLSRDKDVYNKVLQEQEEVAKAKRERGGGNMTWKEVEMMEYTWRVAQELMRFRPPLVTYFRRTTRDIKFEGFDIPKGWQVGFFPTSTHMDNKIFEDPNKFEPSRFDKSLKNYPPYTYVPFGAGPRICPGAEFTKIESMLVIHHFITKYKWKEMIPDEPITLQPLPYPSKGLPVTLQLSNHHMDF